MNSYNKLSLPSSISCTQLGVLNDLIRERNCKPPVGSTAGIVEAYLRIGHESERKKPVAFLNYEPGIHGEPFKIPPGTRNRQPCVSPKL